MSPPLETIPFREASTQPLQNEYKHNNPISHRTTNTKHKEQHTKKKTTPRWRSFGQQTLNSARTPKNVELILKYPNSSGSKQKPKSNQRARAT